VAKLAIKPGSTSQTVYVFVPDSASTTGGGKTGIAYNAASLTAYYVRVAGSAAAITLATQTVTGAWSSGGWVEVDATNMPGLYRFDVPDAVLAASSRSAIVYLKGAAGMAPVLLEIDLSNQADAVSVSGTGLTARDIGASVLLSSGTGTGQISLTSGTVTLAAATHTGAVIPTVTTLTNLPAIPSNWLTATGIAANAITATGIAANTLVAAKFGSDVSLTDADLQAALLTTALTESYAADGVAPTLTQAVLLILQRLCDASLSGTTLTIKKLDGNTTAATLTTDDDTTPTSVSRST
jgi:hypothetical protein